MDLATKVHRIASPQSDFNGVKGFATNSDLPLHKFLPSFCSYALQFTNVKNGSNDVTYFPCLHGFNVTDINVIELDCNSFVVANFLDLCILIHAELELVFDDRKLCICRVNRGTSYHKHLHIFRCVNNN